MLSSFLANIPSSVEIPVPFLAAAILAILLAYIIQEKQLMPILQEKEESLSGVNIIQTRTAEISASSSSDTSSNDDLKSITPESVSVQSRISRSSSYRMEEECSRKSSSEYTRRGQLWSKHASWNLPKAPRLSIKKFEKSSIYPIQGLQHVFTILERYNVDPRRGFLPSQDPLQRLPYARYHLWEDLADDLPKLLGARLGQARGPLRQLPALKTDKLVTDAELRRAHLLLCIFAHAYVWGGPEPMDEIPEGIAIPLWEVARRLDMPPVLGHPSIVLYNWRRLDVEADICMENLSTLNNFFDGRDESWFYLITVELEQRGAASVVPMMLLIDAIQRFKEEAKHLSSQRERTESTTSTGSADSTPLQTPDPVDLHSDDDYSWEELRSNDEYDGGSGDQDDSPREEEALIGELTSQRVATYVTMQLKKIADAIMGMVLSMGAMREGCHPFIFYNRVRPFLSAWKNNPTLPNGVIYQGVSDERQHFYGGSAAQSSLLPFLDIGLGVSHESIKSQDFLLAMRDYMPLKHREFLKYLETVACVREYILDGLMSHGITLDTPSESKAPCPQESHRSHLGSSNGNCSQGPTSCPNAPALSGAALKAFKETKVWLDLRDAYNSCIDNLQAFRSCHMSIVAEYIIAQQKKGVNKDNLEGSAGGKGTGGTDLMNFLKPIRDNVRDSFLASPTVEASDEKNNAGAEDVDLFRGAANPAGKVLYKASPSTSTDIGWNSVTTGPIVFTLSQQ